MKKIFIAAVLSAFAGGVALAEDNGIGVDRRPVLLIHSKDMHDRTEKVGENLKGISDLVEGALAELGIYRIITDNAVGRSLQDDEMFRFLNGDNGAGEMKMTVPGYRLEMDVVEYSSQIHEGSSASTVPMGRKMKFAVTKTKTVSRKASVRIQFKIIDIKTQETVFSETVHDSDQAKSTSTAVATMRGSASNHGKLLDSADVLLSQTVNKVIAEFIERVKDFQSYHVLSCSDEGVLTLDASIGVVKPGDIMRVMNLGKETVSRKTGKSIRPERQVATIKIVAANEESAAAEFVTIDDPDCDWHVVVRRIRK